MSEKPNFPFHSNSSHVSFPRPLASLWHPSAKMPAMVSLASPVPARLITETLSRVRKEDSGAPAGKTVRILGERASGGGAFETLSASLVLEAHKEVLSAASEVLRTALNEASGEECAVIQVRTRKADDIFALLTIDHSAQIPCSPEVVSGLLDLFYTGKAKVESEDIRGQILYWSKQLKVEMIPNYQLVSIKDNLFLLRQVPGIEPCLSAETENAPTPDVVIPDLFQCELCQEDFSTKDDLLKHLDGKDSAMVRVFMEKMKLKTDYDCPGCGMVKRFNLINGRGLICLHPHM